MPIDVILPIYTPGLPLPQVYYNIEKLLENTGRDINLILVASDKPQPININNGLDRVKSEYVAILDWDVSVPVGWLDPLIQILEKNDGIGMVGAKMGGEYEEWGGLASQVDSDETKEIETLPGGCMVFKNIGIKWDEKFPSGYWADNDFCRQFKEKGYKIYIHGGVLVNHDLLSSRTNGNKEKWMREGQEIYKEKWGNLNF